MPDKLENSQRLKRSKTINGTNIDNHKRGLCGSSEPQDPAVALEVKKTKEIDKQSLILAQQDRRIKKLLLLGAGESGKSTIFKQSIILYGTGFHEEQRRGFIGVLFDNTIQSIQELIRGSADLVEHGEPQAQITQPNETFRDMLRDLPCENTKLTQQIADAITALWNDAGIQYTFAHRARFQVPDSAAYFFNRVQDFCRPGFLPTVEDVLRTRVRTTGIVETTFDIPDEKQQAEVIKFKIIDVGGQRNERKKWINCFSEVTSIIFVAALSEYDQVCFEDHTTNRMDEALKVFEEAVNYPCFSTTAVILFLNKVDLFDQKFPLVPLTKWDPSFPFGNDREMAKTWILERFKQKNKHMQREIYYHITCATNTENMKMVFNSVKDIVVRASLRAGGLIQ